MISLKIASVRFRRIGFVLLAFLIGQPYGAGPSSFAAVGPYPQVDSAFWKLKLKTIAGDSVRMKSLEGNYLLLNFWGEWCPKCQEELPFLLRQEKKFSGSGLRIVGFLKTNNLAKAKKLLAEKGSDWTQIPLDEQVERIFEIQKFPTNLLISPEGKIVMDGFSNHYQDFKKRLHAAGPASEIKKSEIQATTK